MCKIIAIASQKGGTGKTTTAANLGHALAEKKKKVLLIDLDPQSSLSISLGIPVKDLEKTIYNALTENDEISCLDLITIETPIHGLYLIPSNIDLSEAEQSLMAQLGRERVLQNTLESVRDDYDFILIDCPPSLALLTTNALTAADSVLVPIQCDYLALRGATVLFNTVMKIKKRLNPALDIIGILPTMFDKRTRHSQEVLEEIKSAFPGKVFNSIIKFSVKAKDAPIAAKTLLSDNGKSDLADAYRSLAQEILNHG